MYHHGPACPGLVGDSPPPALIRPLTNPCLPASRINPPSTSWRQLKWNPYEQDWIGWKYGYDEMLYVEMVNWEVSSLS